MFCTTFYSYKGGVGRTLALANVACVFAKQGRRVLVVDFDLEAPGLPTLPGFSCPPDHPGIVDLIHSYLTTGKAPEVQNFVHTGEFAWDFHDDETDHRVSGTFSIDIMSAGQNADGGYSDRLNRIDWNDLYAERDGFLLMEDVRAQWAKAGYDYVLIDSRTGLTDVGGICTRQLPDAVVAVFFPNEQNLVGLKQVVEGVRASEARPQPIELSFVASRLPRLDDEHGHLMRWLRRFQDELGYGDERLTRVQHYDSLMLLNQSLFVLDRPGSGLAKEYRDVARGIAGLNDEDPDGALAYLTAFTSRRMRQNSEDDVENLARLERIGTMHAEDFAVQFALARAFYSVRDLLKAEGAAAKAIVSDGRTRTSKTVSNDSLPSARRLRLRVLSEQGRSTEALEDAISILHDAEAGRTALVDAALAVATADPAALASATSLPAVAAASPSQLIQLAEQLTAVRGMKRVSADIVELALHNARDSGEQTGEDVTDAQLILIAGHRFAVGAALGSDEARASDPHVAFNTAVALWGRDGTADPEVWRQVAEVFRCHPGFIHGANARQCLALLSAVLGDVDATQREVEEARRLIRLQGRREFSCWTYSNVAPTVFEEHLDAIEAFANGDGPSPAVLSASEAN